MLNRIIEASLNNLEAVTARIRSGEGSLGKLLHDDAMSKSLTSATSNLDAITARINKGEGTAGKLISDAELYNRLNSLSDRILTVSKLYSGIRVYDASVQKRRLRARPRANPQNSKQKTSRSTRTPCCGGNWWNSSDVGTSGWHQAPGPTVAMSMCGMPSSSHPMR